MNKLVYLFELDSVRTTQAEIEKGQNAMFEEIAENGNAVVLTFNQLTDSRAFMAAVYSKDTYGQIMELFRMGALKVSHFGGRRTPSQYLQEAIEKCSAHDQNTFIFSALPVLSTETGLLETLHAALRFSDPALIGELAEEKRRLMEAEGENPDSLAAEIDRLDFLERYVRMILLLSTEKLSGNPPVGRRTTRFHENMAAVLDFYGRGEEECTLQAVNILRQIERELEEADGGRNRDNRSAWVRKLYQMENSDDVCMAEAICDICYNFTNEESILHVSRHFDGPDAGAFLASFDERLKDYWQEYQQGIHVFHQGDRNDAIRYDGIRLPRWITAARMYSAHEKEPRFSGELYEREYHAEKKRWKSRVLRSYVNTLLVSLVYILILVGIDMVMEWLQERFFDGGDLTFRHQLLMAAASSLAFGVLGAVITLLTRLPDFLDAFRSIFFCIGDLLVVKRSPKGCSFRHKTEEGGEPWTTEPDGSLQNTWR